jgi:hypothetical protein
VEITEQKQLPGFGFVRRRGIESSSSQEAAFGEKAPKTSNSPINTSDLL